MVFEYVVDCRHTKRIQLLIIDQLRISHQPLDPALSEIVVDRQELICHYHDWFHVVTMGEFAGHR